MKKTVYLAGLISTDRPASLAWRQAATVMLSEVATVLSPMRGKDNLALQTTDGGVTDVNRSGAEIVLRDYRDVVNSHAMLAHLEDFGSSRPLIGTIAELAWAWEGRTPVVGIAHKGNRLMRSHPFITNFVSRYVESVDEGVDVLMKYWLL